MMNTQRFFWIMAIACLAVVVRSGPPKSSAAYAATATVEADDGPTIAGCPVFPADNPWNRDIFGDPVDPKSARYIASINGGRNKFLHADFGSNPDYGFPYMVVSGTEHKTNIIYTEYGDESDPGPFPIPMNAPIEGGDDKHVLVIERDNCILYELYHARRVLPNWEAGSGAMFDLRSNNLRPDTWTSTDQAGLPIFPGLVRYDEVIAGAINHALRFTVQRTQKAFIHPATHYGSSDNPNDPPMGLRLRLKANYDISKVKGQARVVLEALKKYGMFVADTGTSWYISGATNAQWDDDDLDRLKRIPGNAFEVVKTGEIIKP